MEFAGNVFIEANRKKSPVYIGVVNDYTTYINGIIVELNSMSIFVIDRADMEKFNITGEGHFLMMKRIIDMSQDFDIELLHVLHDRIHIVSELAVSFEIFFKEI